MGKGYQRPDDRARLVSWVLRIVPKSDPFRSLAFRAPAPEVEKMFMGSFNATIDSYRTFLVNVDAGVARAIPAGQGNYAVKSRRAGAKHRH